jgi:hypothetical protein
VESVIFQGISVVSLCRLVILRTSDMGCSKPLRCSQYWVASDWSQNEIVLGWEGRPGQHQRLERPVSHSGSSLSSQLYVVIFLLNYLILRRAKMKMMKRKVDGDKDKDKDKDLL